MATFLELFKELHEESGASGASPSTTIGQTGEYLRLRNWIVKADFDIQTLWHDWNFLVDFSFSYSTQAGTYLKTADTTMARWDHKTFKLDNDPIEVVEYHRVKQESFYTTDASDRGTPWRVIIRPDQSLQFDPVPDDAYVITADRWLKPVKMGLLATTADNAEISKIPTQFHNLIVAKALIYYGIYENADDALAHGQMIWEEHLPRLESAERPNAFGSNYTLNGNMIEVIAE